MYRPHTCVAVPGGQIAVRPIASQLSVQRRHAATEGRTFAFVRAVRSTRPASDKGSRGQPGGREAVVRSRAGPWPDGTATVGPAGQRRPDSARPLTGLSARALSRLDWTGVEKATQVRVHRRVVIVRQSLSVVVIGPTVPRRVRRQSRTRRSVPRHQLHRGN